MDDEPDKVLQLDDYEKMLLDAVITLEDELMNIEMLLQLALSKSKEDYEAKCKVIYEEWITKTQNFISFVNEKVVEFQESIKVHAMED